MRGKLQSTALALALLALLALPSIGAAERLKIGMAKTFLSGVPKAVVDIVGSDFSDVMKATTGLDGELDTALTPKELGQRLHERKLDFAIFFGHEFAAVRKLYPTLQPLMIVTSKQGDRAHVIVRQGSSMKSAAELSGKKVDVPLDAREYCRVFLSQLKADHRQGGGDFLGSVAQSPLQYDALTELALGKIDAVIVDSVALAHYKKVRGPVFTKNLKVLLESEAFPAPAIVYNPGALDGKVLDQFRDGLRKARTTDDGQRLMDYWKIDSFDPVPQDYEKSLSNTLKSYPVLTS